MNRRTSLFAGLLLVVTPLLSAQEPQERSATQITGDALAVRQLVAWSRLQTPRPVPQPLPPPDRNPPQPDQQTTQPPNPSTQPENRTQTFMGRVAIDGDKYVLKVAGGISYRLDAEGNMKEYANKDVKIFGTLDTENKTIRVVKIELLT